MPRLRSPPVCMCVCVKNNHVMEPLHWKKHHFSFRVFKIHTLKKKFDWRRCWNHPLWEKKKLFPLSMSSQIFPLDSHSQTNSHIVIWRSDRFVSSSSSMRFTGQQVLFPVCNLYFYCVYNSHAYCSLYNHTPSHRALCSQTRWQETHLTCIFIFVFIVTFQKFPSNLPDNSMQLSSFVCLLLHCSALTSLSCCLILLCSVYCRCCRNLTFVP